MFLLHILLVITVVFWTSAIIAEAVMRSSEEVALGSALRVAYGFFISLAYFSAIWLILSIQQAWILGVILLGLYSGKIFLCPVKKSVVRLRHFLRQYLRVYILFILGSFVFFTPLILSNTYGPFTEGGGDVSIYSDVAKYQYENHLNEIGLSSQTVSDLRGNVKEILSQKTAEQRWDDFNHELANPPAAEAATYRIILLRAMNTFLYVPYAMYGFLNAQTNLPVYFGIQAFLYVCMLAGFYAFFRRFGKVISCFAVALLLSSHAVSAVFYNMFAMQACSLSIAALMLAILPSIRLYSLAGIRTYGCMLYITWLSYIIYFSVILPVLLSVTFFTKVAKKKKSIKENPIPIFRIVPSIFFVSICLFALFMCSAPALNFLKGLLMQLFSRANASVYMGGDPLSCISKEWWSFLFGFLSQQHFYPLAEELPSLDNILKIGIASGLIAILSGLLIIFKIFIYTKFDGYKKLYLVIYGTLIITLLIQFYLASHSLYTQAKGAQNTLVYLYVLMLLPLGMSVKAKSEGLKTPWLASFLVISLMIFISKQFSIQWIYDEKIAHQRDRGAILEPSYFLQAKRIKKLDVNPFVLFEPRKSSDLYLSDQPFFGSRMVPTRHLVLQRQVYDAKRQYWDVSSINIPGLIKPSDLPHLWSISATCTKKSESAEDATCIWSAQKLIEQKTPSLLMFGDNYNRDFGESPITRGLKVAYLRNAMVMLFLPASYGGNLEVILQPRDESFYKSFYDDFIKHVQNNEFGNNVKITKEHLTLKLTSQLTPKNDAQLLLIASLNTEYCLNVTLNGREIF